MLLTANYIREAHQKRVINYSMSEYVRNVHNCINIDSLCKAQKTQKEKKITVGPKIKSNFDL